MHSTASFPAGSIIGLAALALATACDSGPVTGTDAPSAPARNAPGCAPDAFLESRLYGAFEVDIGWRGTALDCEGMRRPDGAGARLRFAGELAGGHRVTIIIALPGLQPGTTADELASNVTLIEEGSGRFYSTTGLDNCWTDVVRQSPLGGSSEIYVVAGTLYCISPLGEVNGDASVSLPELRFSGRLDWTAS